MKMDEDASVYKCGSCGYRMIVVNGLNLPEEACPECGYDDSEEDGGLSWSKAKKRLDQIRLEYTKVGVTGLPGLTMVINPLLVRYENGERTKELYNAMIKLE